MYKEYHECWYKKILTMRKIEKLQQKLETILLELSKATSKIKEITVNSSGLSDKMSNLIAEKADTEEIIKSYKMLFDYQKSIEKQKLNDLKESKELYDIVYYSKFILKKKPKEIASIVNYSKSYTYDLLSEIRLEMKKVEERQKRKKT